MYVQIKLDETRGRKIGKLRLDRSGKYTRERVNDIDCVPPTKSSAERRIRATSPKALVDEAAGGSVISPEPVGAGSAGEMPRHALLLSFVAP
jgi:hypothetical protein